MSETRQLPIKLCNVCSTIRRLVLVNICHLSFLLWPSDCRVGVSNNGWCAWWRLVGGFDVREGWMCCATGVKWWRWRPIGQSGHIWSSRHRTSSHHQIDSTRTASPWCQLPHPSLKTPCASQADQSVWGQLATHGGMESLTVATWQSV